MKILLLGEYSNVHATLAEGLRDLGHEVTVISNGDFWKDYPRDIDVSRKPGKLGGLMLLAKLYSLLPKMRGYDVVQLINPMFFEVKAERLFYFYKYLRKHNKSVFLGAFGMDYYWVRVCTKEKLLRYSDFNIGDKLRTDEDAIREQKDWIGTSKEGLNRLIACNCNGIISGLYEYQVCYETVLADKTRFIPFPIKMPEKKTCSMEVPSVIRFFIGISKNRSTYKGTDIMLKALTDVCKKYPHKTRLIKAEGVSFQEYGRMMDESDVLLDQLYSYTPAMNALLAMSKGIIVVGGGEPENYQILGEEELRPIINVEPSYESVYKELEALVLHPERIPTLKQQSIAYIKKHHEYRLVAKKYEEFYKEKSRNT